MSPAAAPDTGRQSRPHERPRSPVSDRAGRRFRLVYASRWWKEVRKTQLAMWPRCEWPECTEPATDVDHIVPIRAGGTHDPSNLQSLCHSHHSTKTGLERYQHPVEPQQRCEDCGMRWPLPTHLCGARLRLDRLRRRKAWCERCGRLFLRQGKEKYCGSDCRSAAMRHPAGALVPCAACGAVRYRPPSRATRSLRFNNRGLPAHPFCSPECYSSYSRVMVECMGCGSSMETTRSRAPVGPNFSRRKFCRDECYQVARDKRSRGEEWRHG